MESFGICIMDAPVAFAQSHTFALLHVRLYQRALFILLTIHPPPFRVTHSSPLPALLSPPSSTPLPSSSAPLYADVGEAERMARDAVAGGEEIKRQMCASETMCDALRVLGEKEDPGGFLTQICADGVLAVAAAAVWAEAAGAGGGHVQRGAALECVSKPLRGLAGGEWEKRAREALVDGAGRLARELAAGGAVGGVRGAGVARALVDVLRDHNGVREAGGALWEAVEELRRAMEESS